MKVLDLSRLPKEEAFRARSIMIGPSEEVLGKLTVVPHVSRRIRAAYWFAAKAGLCETDWIAEAYLRASLTELCSIEEILKDEAPSLPAYSISESNDPLLHLIKMLRNLNVHVSSLPLALHSFEAVMGDKTFAWRTYVIVNLDANSLKSLNSGRHYSLPDLESMVAWFLENQMHWGAGDVFRIGLDQLVTEICVRCKFK